LFRPIDPKQDLVELEHEILELWRERRTFARLRAQIAGNDRWSFLDGPITANNPMGAHHAWGRTLKDVFQRYKALRGFDQRYQNGFDCQGLWIEVGVERELGLNSKREIEAFGLAEFASLCKQRVLTYAARQTEQSIRLGMWMDWNDADELRRLRDLLAEDPMQQATIQGVDGPVTDTVEMLVGRLGTKDVGGSYFTFSNENNDLIWGFLAECNRRGWIYKGLDSMPWCPRCGTGLSQMEMNEGYADREDPGLTIKLPLLDRPGEALLVWTTTPWTLSANIAAAVGPDMRYVKVRQGDDAYWVGRGVLQKAVVGEFKVEDEKPGSELVGWRYSGPFDDLPAVKLRAPRGGVGRGRRGRGHRHRPHCHGCRRRGLPARQDTRPADHRRDQRRRPLSRWVWLAERQGSAQRRAGHRRRSRTARAVLPPRAVPPPLPALLAVRHAAAVAGGRRVVHLDGPRLRQAAHRADPRRGRRQPPLPDHGGRRSHPLDPVVRL
jgi:isoleucyl-tRNA synthetase